MTTAPSGLGSGKPGMHGDSRQGLYLATTIVEAVLLLVLAGLLVRANLQARHQKTVLADAQAKMEQQDKELSAGKTAIASLEDQLQSLSLRLEAGQKQMKTLEQERAAALKHRDSLEQEMRSALQSKDVTISELQGKLTVNILDRIMFASGEAVIKPEGEPVLRKIGDVLKQYPNRRLLVVGHTDNVPIRSGAHSKFPSNWELSAARATAAVRYLVEKAGFDPRRIGAVGYGENQPIADNRTAEGRAKNRRISITIMEADRLVETPPAAPAPDSSVVPPKAPGTGAN